MQCVFSASQGTSVPSCDSLKKIMILGSAVNWSELCICFRFHSHLVCNVRTWIRMSRSTRVPVMSFADLCLLCITFA